MSFIFLIANQSIKHKTSNLGIYLHSQRTGMSVLLISPVVAKDWKLRVQPGQVTI
ncbi:MAG: hypothetical protein ACLFVR_11950 [Thiohalospira sp.]